MLFWLFFFFLEESCIGIGSTFLPGLHFAWLNDNYVTCRFGQMIACFRYASIDVHSVYLPPPKLDFNYEGQEWMQNELHKVK